MDVNSAKVYNFLDPRLSPKVSSSICATDNYEVENLIDKNTLIRSRGFLGYGPLKPPADVDFELLCPVNIHYIDLDTVLGTQRCSEVEIFIQKASSDQFVSVARANYENDGVRFFNKRLEHTLPNCGNYHKCCFKLNMFWAFSNSARVKVRILRTNKSVPCIAGVKIFGTVSRTCSRVTSDTINRLMQANSNIKEQTKFFVEDVKERVESQGDTPKDFLDSLTYEIMSIPMTLPSGNNVDKSTLEKHMCNEATYGRTPSDPFTGQIFTSNRKPVLNTALKSRIDAFLLQHANEPGFFSTKRTLGRKPKAQNEDNLLQNKRVKLNNEESAPGHSSAHLDLEQLLRNVVASEDFHTFTKDESQENKRRNCEICKKTENLYVIPCEHLFCRECVLEISKTLKCAYCNVGFSKKDVVKFHL